MNHTVATNSMKPTKEAAQRILSHPGEIHRSTMLMDEELRSKLDEAIQKLPYNYRVVFILRDVEGQSAEETGKILKLTVPAVKSRLRRARVFLREQFKRVYDGMKTKHSIKVDRLVRSKKYSCKEM